MRACVRHLCNKAVKSSAKDRLSRIQQWKIRAVSITGNVKVPSRVAYDVLPKLRKDHSERRTSATSTPFPPRYVANTMGSITIGFVMSYAPSQKPTFAADLS